MNERIGVVHFNYIVLAVLIVLCVSTGHAGDAGIGGDGASSGGQGAAVQWEQDAAAFGYGGAADGRVRAGIVMADLLQIDGRLLMAATDGRNIDVLELVSAERLRPLAKSEAQDQGRILALKWWRPASSRPIYLTLVTWSDQRVRSRVFSLADGRLVPAATRLDSILGTFDSDGDGLPETLLSQEFDPESFFGRRIKELQWNGDRLAARRPAFDLSPKFTVIGGQLADVTGDGTPEAIWVRNGILRIWSGKEEIYTSAKQMGGSLSVLTYKKYPDLKDSITTSVFFEVSPAAEDIDGDGISEVVAVASDQSAFKVPGIATSVRTSRLMAFKFKEGGFIRGTLGEPVQAAVQGLAVADGRVWFMSSDTGTFLRPGGASRLHALVLRQ